MFSITYKSDSNETVVNGFDSVFDCLKQLQDEGFDMENPVNGNTVTDHNGTFAIMSYR